MCGERLASLLQNGEVSVWDLKTRSKVAVILRRDTGVVISLDMSDSILVIASCMEAYIRIFSVTDNYSCIGASGAFDWIHDAQVSSVHVLDSDHVMSTSDDQTIAISAIRSNNVVARMSLGCEPWTSAVLLDGSIAVLTFDDGFAGSGGDITGTVIFTAPPAAVALLKAHGEAKNRYRWSQA